MALLPHFPAIEWGSFFSLELKINNKKNPPLCFSYQINNKSILSYPSFLVFLIHTHPHIIIEIKTMFIPSLIESHKSHTLLVLGNYFD